MKILRLLGIRTEICRSLKILFLKDLSLSSAFIVCATLINKKGTVHSNVKDARVLHYKIQKRMTHFTFNNCLLYQAEKSFGKIKLNMQKMLLLPDVTNPTRK